MLDLPGLFRNGPAPTEGAGPVKKKHREWEGRATTTAYIRLSVFYTPNDSVTYIGGATKRVDVHPRSGWTAEGLGLLRSASLDKRSLAPKPEGYWKRNRWGQYWWNPKEPGTISYSTKSGSGPWAGTKYLRKMPNLKKKAYMYAHPDLYSHGPDHPSMANCDGNLVSGSVHSVNADCGTSGQLTAWRNIVEPHERKHQSSYNKCVREGAKAADEVAMLEAVAAQNIRTAADDVVRGLYAVLEVALDTDQTWTVPERIWHYREAQRWLQVPAGGASDSHHGTDGCP